MKDRRSSRRFPLKLPLTISWNDDGLATNEVSEFGNVGISGVYFQLSKELKRGLEMEIAMTLPNGTVIQCRGRVLRSRLGDSGNVGVAAEIGRYELLPTDEFETRRREFFGL